VVIGATAATAWRGKPQPAPAAATNPSVNHSAGNHASVALSSDPARGSFSSQIPDTSVAAQDQALRTRPGDLVAQGRDFRIERVRLTHPATVTVRGKDVTATTVLRIVITAGPYQMRDLPSIVSLGGNPLAVGLEATDLASLTAFTFDGSVLTQGATLAVSWGLPTSQSTTWTSVIEVLE